MNAPFIAPSDDFGEYPWTTPEDVWNPSEEFDPATEHECDWCPYSASPDELYDMGNGAFVCVDCCRQDQWFSGDRPDLQTLADASLLGDR